MRVLVLAADAAPDADTPPAGDDGEIVRVRSAGLRRSVRLVRQARRRGEGFHVALSSGTTGDMVTAAVLRRMFGLPYVIDPRLDRGAPAGGAAQQPSPVERPVRSWARRRADAVCADGAAPPTDVLRAAAAGAARRSCVIVGTAANIGGVEQVIITLARHLEASGRHVDVVFPMPQDVPRFLAYCAAGGFGRAQVSGDVIDAAATHNVATTLALARFARRTRADVFNVHYGDNFMSLKDLVGYRLGRPRARLVVTVHHPTPWSSTSQRKRWMTRAAGWLTDAVVVVSNATSAVVLETPVAPRKVVVVLNGIELDGRRQDREAARAELGIGADEVAVVSVCRLVQHKRIDDLIRAAAIADVPGMRVLVGGDGPERAALEQLAAESPAAHAELVGYVASIDRFLAAGDIFALPSELEGFGMVFVEAAIHGVPSIGGNAGGSREVIVDGVTGVLVEPGDVAAIADALRRLATSSDERRSMGDAAAHRAATHYDARTMADRYADVLGLGPSTRALNA